MVKLRILSKEETPKRLSAIIRASELSEKTSKSDCHKSMTDNYSLTNNPAPFPVKQAQSWGVMGELREPKIAK